MREPPLLLSKLFRPPVTKDHVHRDRLYDELEVKNRLTLVCAPSGYGKSAAVSDWLETAQKDFVWLSLDEEDNEIGRFIRYLSYALSQHQPAFGQPINKLLNSPEKPDPEQLSTAFINELTLLKRKLVLVIDDYHRIHSKEVTWAVEHLLRYDIPYIKMVIITRTSPSLPLTEWTYRGWVNRVGLAQLSFTEEETLQFLMKTTHLQEMTQQLQTLQRLSEGWITGIRMLAVNGSQGLSHQDIHPQYHKKLPLFKQLTDQFLSNQLQEVQQVLLVAALFQVIQPKLLKHVFLNDLEKATLIDHTMDMLKRSELFIIPLDHRFNEFRFHHLFGEVLLVKAQNYFSQKELKTFYDRAGLFFEEVKDHKNALDSYLKAGKERKALAVFKDYRVMLLNRKDWSEYEVVFQSFPEHYQDLPLLQLSEAWIYIYYGKPREMFDLLPAIERSISKLPDHEIDTILLLAEFNALFGYRLYHIERDYSLAIERCKDALAHLPGDYDYPRGWAWMFLLASYQITGKISLAEKVGFAALSKGIQVHEDCYILIVFCYLYWFELNNNRLFSTAKRLLKLSQENDHQEGLYCSLLFLAKYHYVGNQLEKVRHYVGQMLPIAPYAMGIQRILGKLLASMLDYRKGEVAQAFSSLELLKAALLGKGNNLYDYALGVEAEILVKEGKVEKACALIGDLAKLLKNPLTNFFDPRLSATRVLLHSDDTQYLKKTEELIGQLSKLALTTCNKRLNLEISLLQALWQYRTKGIETCEGPLLKVIEQAAKTTSLYIFIDAGPLMLEVLQRVEMPG